MNLTRRAMMARSTVMVGGAIAAHAALADPLPTRKFTLDLRGSSIGVQADQHQAIHLAHQFGYESVTPDPGYLAKLSNTEREELLAELKEKKLVWGSAGLPAEFRQNEETFRRDLAALPKFAKAMQHAGVTRVGTWLMPCHDELTYVKNFRQHAKRLRECARILEDHGQRFGLEYVGPKTLWTSRRHSFIHSMAETKDLIGEINVGNMGFVLDSWHWYTAHETTDDLQTLTTDDIVACDLNDAPKGKEIDQQIDNQRELPATTGVIDVKAFLTELTRIGYDGPVRAEPFNQKLNELDNESAVQATAVAMRKAFELV